MTAAAARARIEKWIAPISADAPAGQDARYEPLHEQIRAEAAKLESASGGIPNWEQLQKDAEQLTTSTAKDLLIESYAAYALYQNEGLLGLASGLFLLSESMDKYWDVMFPPARRIRARVSAIAWLTEKLELSLPETPVGAGDHDAVAALDEAATQLRTIVAAKFEDQAPAVRPIVDAVERLKLSLPERAEAPAKSDTDPPPAPDPAAAPAAPAASAEPATSASPPQPESAPVATPADASATPDAPAEAAPPPEPKKEEDPLAEVAEAASAYTAPIAGENPPAPTPSTSSTTSSFAPTSPRSIHPPGALC